MAKVIESLSKISVDEKLRHFKKLFDESHDKITRIVIIEKYGHFENNMEWVLNESNKLRDSIRTYIYNR